MKPSHSGSPPFVVLRLILASALLLLGFASVAYVIALLVAWQNGQPGPTAAGALAGIICALAALLFITIFHLRRETLVIPVEDRQAFLRRLGGQLEELGYAVSLPGADRLVGRPAFHAFLFGGNIDVRLGDLRAVLTGPKVYLERLRNGMRLHTYLEQMPHALAAVRRRQAGRLLRAVRIRLEVPGELLPEVYREIAAALSREGATLRCELCIHAQGTDGLRDHAIQAHIQDWLNEQQIPAEIDKEPLVPVSACG